MRLQPDGHCDDWAVRFDAWYSLPWHALAPNVKPVQYCRRPLGPPNHLSSSNGQRLLCARGAPPNIHGAPSGLRARQSCRRCRALVRLPAARAGPTCTLGKRRGRRSTLPCDPRTPVAREGAQPSGGDMPRARRPESPRPSWARGARAAQPQSTASRLSSVGCIRLCWEARRTNAPGARTGHAPPAPAPGLSAGLPGNRPHYNKQQFMRVPHGASGYVGEVCSHPARAHVFWGAPGGVPQDGCRSHATGPVAWVCPQARARAGASPGFRPRLRNRTEPVRDPPRAHTNGPSPPGDLSRTEALETRKPHNASRNRRRGAGGIGRRSKMC